jgi:hypothetical protein
MAKSRYWTAVLAYEGKDPFSLSSPAFCVITEHETVAHEELEAIVHAQWAKLVPYPPPKLIKVVPGRLVMVGY